MTIIPTEKQIFQTGNEPAKPITQYYMYNTKTPGMCYIWNIRGDFIGCVTIEKGVWTPHYQEGIKYLPISSALRLMGYSGAENNVIE